MADYYPLLKRAVAGLVDAPASDRLPIYSRARAALERQLRSFDPPLTEEAIRTELDALDGVIARIEAENTAPGETDEAPAIAPPEDLPPTKDAEPAGATSGVLENSPADRAERIDPPALSTDEPPVEAVIRPRAPMRAEPRSSKKSLALFGSIALALMVGVGVIALTRRNDPHRFQAAQAPPLVTAQPERVKPDESKTEGRLGSNDPVPSAPTQTQPKDPVPPPARPVETRPAAPAETAKSTPAISSPAIPAVSRSFMVVEVPGSAPNQFEGRVNWIYSPDPSLKGQKSLRAKIDFANAGLAVEFSVARNSDPALNASHTVMVIFEPGNAIDNIREMSAVEWRERENQNGQTLAGIVVPVQDNVFMIGLDKSEAGLGRNLDLLRTQKWMVFEVRLANGRRGAILAEKGPLGDKAIADALADWK